MSIGPIPWKDIIDYAHYREFDEELTSTLHTVIRAMDSVYLEWQEKEQSKK